MSCTIQSTLSLAISDPLKFTNYRSVSDDQLLVIGSHGRDELSVRRTARDELSSHLSLQTSPSPDPQVIPEEFFIVTVTYKVDLYLCRLKTRIGASLAGIVLKTFRKSRWRDSVYPSTTVV